MAGRNSAGDGPLETLDILVFCINEVFFGVDGGMVGEMMMPQEAELDEVPVQWFHQLLSFGDRKVVYQSPRVVTLSTSEGRSGLVIDQPRDLVKVAIRDICPLPAVFGTIEKLRVFWGGFVLEGKVVLLIDLGRLLD